MTDVKCYQNARSCISENGPYLCHTFKNLGHAARSGLSIKNHKCLSRASCILFPFGEYVIIGVDLSNLHTSLIHLLLYFLVCKTVAFPGILLGGVVQQIQLRTERTGIWGR